MQPIRVVNGDKTPWPGYAVCGIVLAAAFALSYGWVRQWSRVAPGEPATELNSRMAASGASRMQAAAAFKPVSDVQVIADAVPRESLIGMPVQLMGVLVRSTPGPAGFWVSQVRTPEVFIVFPDAARLPIAFHDVLNVTGTVRAAPPHEAIRAEWRLDGEDLDRLARQRVYVEASEVSKAR